MIVTCKSSEYLICQYHKGHFAQKKCCSLIVKCLGCDRTLTTLYNRPLSIATQGPDIARFINMILFTSGERCMWLIKIFTRPHKTIKWLHYSKTPRNTCE